MPEMNPNRPNIVLITTDQQRFDTFGEYAPSFMRTPHLNHLANDGVVFERAFSDCPVCVPARAAYMTGQSVFRHNMGVNAPTCDYFGTENTLPTLLREQGYQTMAIGKMHFHPQRIRHGFDQTITLDAYYREMRESGNPLQPRRHGLGENTLYPTMATIPEALTLTSWITEKSVQFLTEDRDPTCPFFLWVSYSKPHPPIDPPEPYYSMYRNCDIEEPWMAEWADDPGLPEAIRKHQSEGSVGPISPEILKEAKAGYYGTITQIDYNIGRIMAGLQDTGCFFNPNDNTLIIFCADHGECMMDHNMIAKDTHHEGSMHVPFIMRLPKTWEERFVGEKVKDVTTLQDLAPTILKAVGAENIPEEMDGIDLLARLQGKGEKERPYVLCGQGFTNARDSINWAGVTDGRWKYAYYYENGYEELFDIDADPRELKNLAKEQPEKTAELRSVLVAELQRHGGRFLKDGDLYTSPVKKPDDQRRKAQGFPGWMRDKHRSDALH